MAVQKNKVTRSRRNKRRAHDALLTVHSVECPNCGELKLPHHICGFCGFYRGQEILVAKESSLEEDEGY